MGKKLDNLAVFTGNANPKLAKEICSYLGIELSKVVVNRFNDGEVRVQIKQNIRGHDVYVIQPTCPPANEHTMELLILIDALRRASAERITAVIPYYGYARQDRKDQPRVPITAKLIANLLTGAGAHRIITVDLHAGQIQGFFDIPADNLYAINVFVDHIKSLKLKNLAIVSPDVGGIKMTRAYSKRLRAPLAIVDKRRINDKETSVMNIMGQVKGKNVIIIDDMITTGSSLVEAIYALKDAGSKDIYAAITHAVLVGPAIDRLKKAPLKKLFVTDTVPVKKENRVDKIKVLSIAPLLGEAIKRTHNGESISILFD